MAVSERESGDGRAKSYRRVVDALQMEIIEGLLPERAQLPTQDELCQRFGVSRSTVQRALLDLRNDGYIESFQGRGAFVASRTGSTGDRAPALVKLAPYLKAAFEEETVTLDLFSLTAETIAPRVQAQLLRIEDGEIRKGAIRAIRLRMLLPSLDTHLALPRLVDDPTDPGPLERQRELTRTHAYALQRSLRKLQQVGLVPEVSVEIRTVPMTPQVKLYILNGRTALFGWYRVVERPVEIGNLERQMYDVMGLGATLFPFAEDGDHPLIHVFVEQAQLWFDSMWTTIAQPSTYE